MTQKVKRGEEEWRLNGIQHRITSKKRKKDRQRHRKKDRTLAPLPVTKGHDMLQCRMHSSVKAENESKGQKREPGVEKNILTLTSDRIGRGKGDRGQMAR